MYIFSHGPVSSSSQLQVWLIHLLITSSSTKQLMRKKKYIKEERKYYALSQKAKSLISCASTDANFISNLFFYSTQLQQTLSYACFAIFYFGCCFTRKSIAYTDPSHQVLGMPALSPTMVRKNYRHYIKHLRFSASPPSFGSNKFCCLLLLSRRVKVTLQSGGRKKEIRLALHNSRVPLI